MKQSIVFSGLVEYELCGTVCLFENYYEYNMVNNFVVGKMIDVFFVSAGRQLVLNAQLDVCVILRQTYLVKMSMGPIPSLFQIFEKFRGVIM